MTGNTFWINMINVILQNLLKIYVRWNPEINLVMKATVKLENPLNENNKSRIKRNLCRIMNIRIVSIDIRRNVLSFVYQNQNTFDQVRNELKRLGYPIKEILQIKKHKKGLSQGV